QAIAALKKINLANAFGDQISNLQPGQFMEMPGGKVSVVANDDGTYKIVDTKTGDILSDTNYDPVDTAEQAISFNQPASSSSPKSGDPPSVGKDGKVFTGGGVDTGKGFMAGLKRMFNSTPFQGLLAVAALAGLFASAQALASKFSVLGALGLLTSSATSYSSLVKVLSSKMIGNAVFQNGKLMSGNF